MIARYAIAVTLTFATLLLDACASRQEEAARIEREIISQDTALSLAAITRDSQKTSDVAVAQAPSADAIPPTEQLTTTADMPHGAEAGSDPSVVKSARDSVLSLVVAQASRTDEPQKANEAPFEQPAVIAEGMPRRVVEGKYTVQIAASASEDYALRLVDLYTQRGYDPYIDRKVISDVSWYRVRIGHFESVGEAATQRDELINRYSLQAWVDNISQ